MQESVRPCPIGGGGTLDAWSGIGGPCAPCSCTTRRVTERVERRMPSRVVRWMVRWERWTVRTHALLEAAIIRLKEQE
jgi:hypothetical protein